MDLQALAQAIRALPQGVLVALPRDSLLEALCGAAGEATSDASARLVDLTVSEVAKQFGRAPSTIRQWLESGQLEGYKLLGREWRIPHAAVAAFQERQRRTPPRPQSAPPDTVRQRGSLADWRRVAEDQRRDERHD